MSSRVNAVVGSLPALQLYWCESLISAIATKPEAYSVAPELTSILHVSFDIPFEAVILKRRVALIAYRIWDTNRRVKSMRFGSSVKVTAVD